MKLACFLKLRTYSESGGTGGSGQAAQEQVQSGLVHIVHPPLIRFKTVVLLRPNFLFLSFFIFFLVSNFDI